MNNYFSNYKSISNKDNSLRLYRKDNNKRLYVSKALINKYLMLSDKDNGLLVSLSDKDNGLLVNKQGFISLNKLDNKLYDKLMNKALAYSSDIDKLISNHK